MTNKSFKYVELFAGIGGFRQAMDKLGGECILASEIDERATRAYKALYNGAPELQGDVTKINEHDVPDHDVLVGGFPCQSFSVAGKRLGFEDTRGTLFFEVARIAKVKQPKVILLENVKGLVSHDRGKTLDTIVQTLNDIGYTVDFNVLNSKYFGVPQNRERIFIVAIRDDLIEREPWIIEGNTVVPKGKRRIAQLDGLKTFNFDWPSQESVTTRLRDILEDNVDERFYLSEEKTAALVKQLEERQQPQVLRPQRTEYGKAIRKQYEAGDIEESRHNMTELQPRNDEITNTITTVQKDNLLAEPTNPQIVGMLDIKGNESIRRVYTPTGVAPTGVAPTLTTMGGGNTEPKIAEEVKRIGNVNPSGNGMNGAVYDSNGLCPTLNTNKGEGTKIPVEYNRKDGVGKELEVAHTVNHSDWRGLNRNQTQNAVIEEVRPVLTPDREEKRQNGRRFKENDEESFTLTAQDRHGVAIGEKPRYRIRKLTPLECWRLQGFSNEAFYMAKNAGISNSQLYKQAGNAITVNVIDAIGKRLIRYL